MLNSTSIDTAADGLAPARQKKTGLNPVSMSGPTAAVVPARDRQWRVALVGAGNIAETHAAILSERADIEIAAVVDVDNRRATEFAARWKIPTVLEHLEALVALKGVEVAHILVPPPFHMAAACPLLSAGIHTLIEKPLGQSPEECEAITSAARLGHAKFRVNHNFTYHPAHQRAFSWVRAGKLGPLRHVTMDFNMPLHQLSVRQFGHWMFDCPRNLLLEQAVHPLSLLDHLIGPALAVDCLATPEETIGGTQLIRSFLITLRSDSATAQLHFSVGETYPVWRALLICDDGALSVDYLENRVIPEETRRWLPVFGHLHNGLDQARSIIGQEARNISNYVLSTLKFKSRTDVFFLSMRESLGSFYDALSHDEIEPRDDVGARLVALCSNLAERVSRVSVFNTPAPLPIRRQHECEIALIGGTGFIGQHLVAALLRKGKTVAVMARNIRRLPTVFGDPRVVLIRGDATNYEDVRNVVEGAKAVVNLAHGGGTNPAEISRNLLGGARAVAEACLDAQTKRLIFISSIAALYLGNSASVITGLTEPDPHADRREAYSRAKAEAERLLLAMHRKRALPICILRPGIVIGEGGVPFHLGVGFFNSERHCIGWNDGKNPLPFVLAADVAGSIVCALDAQQVEGHCYNIVGDVRLTAREYIMELSRALQRPLRFHPQSVYKLFAIDIIKYVVKRFAGRHDPFPSLYDLRSRGLVARFVCNDASGDLGWQPVADRAEFLRSGIEVYGRS